MDQTYSTPLVQTEKLQRRTVSSTWMMSLAAASFWVLLILAIHWSNPRTLISFHGLLHAAISGQFLSPTAATAPPENPFFAGEPVAYYWFFQFLAAQITRVSGLNIFYSLELLVLIATAVLIITAIFLGRKLFENRLSGILMGYLIIAGTNPFGWLRVVLIAIRRGLGAFKDNPNHLWGVVHPLYSMIRYNDVGGLYGPMLNFFLNITSRPAALASLLVTLFCLEWFLRTRRQWACAALSCALAATAALSPIIGIAAGGTLCVSLSMFWLGRRVFKSTDGDRAMGRLVIFCTLGIVAGLVIASPTYYHLVIGPSSSDTRLSLFSFEGLQHAGTVAASIGLLTILAVVGLIRSKHDRRLFLGTLIASALMLLSIDLTFSLPAGNTSNLFHAAVVLLAVPAAGSILRFNIKGRSPAVSPRLTAAVFIIFLPTTLLLLSSYMRRPAIPVSFDSPAISRLPADSDLAGLYSWTESKSEPNSIFVIDPRDHIAVCGNTAEFPAMTRRPIFTENTDHYIAAPYPESALRFDLAVRLVSGERPKAVDDTYLGRFSRPIYIVGHDSDNPSLAVRMQEIYGPPTFQSGQIFVYKWRPQFGEPR